MPLRRLPSPSLVVGLGILLGACTPTRFAIGSPVPSIRAPATLVCALLAPAPRTPNNMYNPWDTASVQWESDGPCTPEGYQVDVSTSEDFSGEALGGTTDADTLTWSFGTPQDVAAHYYWRVAPIRDGTLGPFSETRVVHAGPKCEVGDEFAIHLQSPAAGADVETLHPTFDWEYDGNGCIFGFSQLFILYEGPEAPIGISGPGTDPMLASNFAPGFTLQQMYDGSQSWDLLEDCGTYYWRVIATGADSNEIVAYTEPRMFRVNLSGACWCRAADLVAPELTSPTAYAHVGTQITQELVPEFLSWTYPGDCGVLGYTIHLSPDHDFSDTELNGGTGSPATAWSPSTTLRPATQYWWKVAASASVTGPFSAPRSFFTGPDCSAASQLMPPELYSPDDDAVLTENFATLHFQAGWPSCLPEGYFVDLQTSATFDGQNLLGEFSQPGTTVITDPLEGCTNYYWRVAAVQDGVRGPFSGTRSFFTNTAPFCPQQPSVPLINRDALCRLGPAMVYPVVDTWVAGTQVEVVGRSADAGWLVITRSSGRGTCFIKRELLDYAGDAATLPEIVAPPPPTPTDVPPACSADLDAAQCSAAGGVWTEKRTSAGWYCACP